MMTNLRKVWSRIRQRVRSFYSQPQKPVEKASCSTEHVFHSQIVSVLKKAEHAPLAYSNDERCRRCTMYRATVFTGPCNHCVVCRKCAAIALWEAQRTETKAECIECHERITSMKHVDFDRSRSRYESYKGCSDHIDVNS